MYNNIVNPITGRKVNIYSKTGNKIIQNYLLYGGKLGEYPPFYSCYSFSQLMDCNKNGKNINIKSYNNELGRGGMGIVCGSESNKALALKIPLKDTHNLMVEEEETGHNEIFKFIKEKKIDHIASAPGKIDILRCNYISKIPDEFLEKNPNAKGLIGEVFDERLALHKQRVYGFDLSVLLRSQTFLNYSKQFKLHPLDLRNEISDKLREIFLKIPGKTKITDLKPSNFMYGIVGKDVDPSQSTSEQRKVIFIDYRITEKYINSSPQYFSNIWVFAAADPVIDESQSKKMRYRGILQLQYGLLGTPEELVSIEQYKNIQGYSNQNTWTDINTNMLDILKLNTIDRLNKLYEFININMDSSSQSTIDTSSLVDINLELHKMSNIEIINIIKILEEVIVKHGEKLISYTHHELLIYLNKNDPDLFEKLKRSNIYSFLDSVEKLYKGGVFNIHNDNLKNIIFSIISMPANSLKRAEIMILYDSLRSELTFKNLNLWNMLQSLGIIGKQESTWFNKIFKLQVTYFTSIKRKNFKLPEPTIKDDILKNLIITGLSYNPTINTQRFIKEFSKFPKEIEVDFTNFPVIIIEKTKNKLMIEINLEEYPFKSPLIKSIDKSSKLFEMLDKDDSIKMWNPRLNVKQLLEIDDN